MTPARASTRAGASPPAHAALERAPEPARVASDAGDFSVTLERTACFGACPVYRVSVRADGEVEFYGIQHVAMPGTHVWFLDAGAVTELRELVEHERFFEIELDCRFVVYDTRDTIVSAVLDGRSHSVVNNWIDLANVEGDPFRDEDAPTHRRIDRIADQIDAIVGTRRWIESP